MVYLTKVGRKCGRNGDFAVGLSIFGQPPSDG